MKVEYDSFGKSVERKVGLGCLMVIVGLVVLAVLALAVGGLFDTFFGSSGGEEPQVNVSTVAAGTEIPVTLGLDGDKGPDILAAGFPKSQEMDCQSWSPIGPLESTTSNTGLQFNPGTRRYGYRWTTEESWAGTCRQLIVQFADNVEDYASGQTTMNIRFT